MAFSGRGHIPYRSRCGRSFAVVLVSIVGLACSSAPAMAHSRLVSSDPADGAHLDRAPSTVTLNFSGTVVAGSDAIQVFAPDASRVDEGSARPRRGERITQSVTSGPDGTYGVAYRVSSEDGHVITATVTYEVGSAESGSTASAAAASRDAARVDRTLEVVFSGARTVELLTLLTVAGGGLFACCIAPGWRPRLLAPALLVLLVAYAVGFLANAAILHGGASGAWTAPSLREAARTPFGLALMARSTIAVVAIGPVVLLRFGRVPGRGGRLGMAVVFVALAASLSITGHAVTTDPIWIRMPVDMVHVVAAAVWLGGLVQVAALAGSARERIRQVVRFSRVAFVSVVVILASGLYAAAVELDLELESLTDSTYGRLVVAKLALYVAIMPLAWNNMRTFVPSITPHPGDATRLLRQYALRELVLLVAIVGMTVWLIATPQP